MSVAVVNIWIQVYYKDELQEWYYGVKPNECDYYIDKYCKKDSEEELEEIEEGAEEFLAVGMFWYDLISGNIFKSDSLWLK